MYKIVNYRNVKAINPEHFCQDILEKSKVITESETLAQKVTAYNKVMSTVLNEHAPLKSRNIKVVPNVPWFDAEYENTRKLRRKAERLYKKTGLLVHKENFIRLRKQTTTLAYKKNRNYYGDKLNSSTNTKVLYSVVNKLLDKKQEVTLPESKSDKELADRKVKI